MQPTNHPQMPNKLVTSLLSCKSQSRTLIPVSQKWHATLAVAAAAAVGMVVAEVTVAVVAVAAVSLLPMLLLLAGPDGNMVDRCLRNETRGSCRYHPHAYLPSIQFDR